MKTRKMITLALAFMMSMSCILFPASAIEPANRTSISICGTPVSVQMADGSPCTLTEAELILLLEDINIQPGAVVTIFDIVEATPKDESVITPFWYESYRNTLISSSGEKKETSDMLFSVARGQTLSLTRECTSKFTFSVVGEIPFDTASIKAEGSFETSYTYSMSETYTGPTDSTRNNTRAFYVNHYYKDETWEQTKLDFALRPIETMQTVVRRPIRSINFSLDSYES